MAKLRVDKIASVGVSTENTGSVFFDGTGDHLKIRTNDDFVFGTGDFTIEFWVYLQATGQQHFYEGRGNTSTNTILINVDGSTQLSVYLNGDYRIQDSSALTENVWHHVALARNGSTTTLYKNGVSLGTYSDSINYAGPNTNNLFIAANAGTDGNGASQGSYVTGYLSNLRICKGHAVYTGNFAPPTRELEVHPETVLLACYDGENIFADKTGRHIIAAYGDRTSSPTPTVTDSPIGITTFNPGLTREVDPTAGPTFQGGVGFTSQNWLTLPKGTTTERDSHGGHRGLFMGGSSTNTIEYVVISTTGNAVDFGDTSGGTTASAACSSSTRGVSAGGLDSPVQSNTIEYVTIATLGNAIDFGNLTDARRNLGASSNSIRGLFFGGSDPGVSNIIDYITIASTGNAIDFGNISSARTNVYGCASPTRGILGGGEDPSVITTIEYVTIASTGDAQDFGDLSVSRSRFSSTSSGTRGVFASGRNPSNVNTIDYVTIASTGNANDFGDVTLARQNATATSDSVRGVIAGGYASSDTNTIDFTVIPAMGNAQDFGDLIAATREFGACSSGHGGLG
jgi:hypothetical protein